MNIYFRVKEEPRDLLLRLEGRDLYLTNSIPATIKLVSNSFPGKAGQAEFCLYKHDSAIVTKAVYEKILDDLIYCSDEPLTIMDIEKLAQKVISDM